MNLQRISAAIAVVVMVVLSGCGKSGPPLTRVTGSVTYNEKPVVGAIVTFAYAGGGIASGNTDAQGKFAIDAPYGEAKVAVTKTSGGASGGVDVQSMTPTEAMAKMHAGAKNQKDMAQEKAELPTKYGSPDTSGLVAPVVEGGTNDFSFALTD